MSELIKWIECACHMSIAIVSYEICISNWPKRGWMKHLFVRREDVKDIKERKDAAENGVGLSTPNGE